MGEETGGSKPGGTGSTRAVVDGTTGQEGPDGSGFALDELEDWRKQYPHLFPIEMLHISGFHPDPFLALKADGDPDNTTFFVAGYSTGGPEVDERFYGLLLDHETRRMDWAEIRGPELRWEGPGQCRYVVDGAWRRTRASEVIRGYPAYTFVPEGERERHPRYPLVTARNLGELKGWLQTARDINSVALVGDYFDLAMAKSSLGVTGLGFGLGPSDLDRRAERALQLAEHGLLRVAVQDLGPVPQGWRPYALALDGLPDRQPCRVTYTGGMYYVRLVGTILPPGGPED